MSKRKRVNKKLSPMDAKRSRNVYIRKDTKPNITDGKLMKLTKNMIKPRTLDDIMQLREWALGYKYRSKKRKK